MQTDSDLQQFSVLFLGVAERAAFVRVGDTNSYQWNVIGLIRGLRDVAIEDFHARCPHMAA